MIVRRCVGVLSWAIASVLVGLLWGCGVKEGAVGFAEMSPAPEERLQEEVEAPRARSMAKEGAADVAAGVGAAPASTEGGEVADQALAARPLDERKRVYSGF